MNRSIYGEASPNDYPLYGIAEAARYLKVSAATLRAWFVGTNQGQFRSVLDPAERGPPPRLSFNNLAEAFVLRRLRTNHPVQLPNIRRAIEEAERELGIGRLLLCRDLKTHAGDLLVGKFGESLHLGASGQFAMKRVLDAALDRFEWQDPRFPSALFPQVADGRIRDRLVVIDPRRSMGAPALASRGITTAIISRRYNLGEPIQGLADDYNVTEEEITAAIVYEEAA